MKNSWVYHVPIIDAETLTSVIQDTYLRLNICLQRLRRPCYNGASNVRGTKSGAAKRISDIEPRALYTHCYGHSLNLAASDVMRNIKIMQDALDTTHEITKFIKNSPCREGIFKRMKGNLPGMCSTGIRVLCPTRWADALTSILQNFVALQETWEEAVEVVCDTEMKVRIHGVSAAMKTFDYLFGAMLGEIILRHSDNLSRTL